MSGSDAPPLHADYFDGLSSRPHPVRLSVAGARLRIDGDGIARELPLAAVRWPERTRHGARIAHLDGGGALHCNDRAAWDAWADAAGLRDSAVVRAQRSWRATLVALAAVLLLLGAGYRWGLPLAARGALAFVPETVDRHLGASVLESLIERRWLTPSERPAAEQQRVRAAFARAVAAADADRASPPYELHFHKSRIGANALALPGGAIVLTDEMVTAVDARDDVLIGVLAHELGHVRERHGMRLVAQAALLGVATGLLVGDFSALAAGVPALLGQLGYSRDFERAADAEALRVLRANGIAPEVMLVMFDRLATPADAALPIALASHPADAERRRIFGAR